MRSSLTLMLVLLALVVSACAEGRLLGRQMQSPEWSAFNEGPEGSVSLAALRSAAESGDPSAEYALAVAYADGRSVGKDMAQAVHWWQRAAAQGQADALNTLAFLYASGTGVALDRDEALRLWRAAAAQGHALAQYNLGGNLVLHAQDRSQLKEGARWLRKAAEQGDAEAQFFLGNLYFSGEGVNRDMEMALTLWQQAAANGHVQARAALNGQDVHVQSRAAWHVANISEAMPDTVPAYKRTVTLPEAKARPKRSRRVSRARSRKTMIAPPPQRPDVVASPAPPKSRPSYEG